MEVAILWALKNGFFDDISVKKIAEAEESFESFISTTAPALLDKILSDKIIGEELEKMLADAAGQWKKTFA